MKKKMLSVPLQDLLKEYEDNINGAGLYELEGMLQVLNTIHDAVTSVEMKLHHKLGSMLMKREKSREGKK